MQYTLLKHESSHVIGLGWLMTILVCGVDGYIGWSLAVRLATTVEDEVVGVDNLGRRKWVKEVGSWSAIPIPSIEERIEAFRRVLGKKAPSFVYGDLRDFGFVRHILDKYRPHTIVHLAEQPSAPYSMIDAEHAVFTQSNNIVGTLNLLYAIHQVVPDCHLVKMGTLGEYGRPKIEIPEGFFEIEYRGKRDVLPFPKMGDDWYHCSKIHDSQNIMFACKVWDLRSTDIMQGIVYGTRTDETVEDSLLTRFDFDAVFGTVLNRFCAQALVDFPLTVYGTGDHISSFISLRDSVRCLQLIIENPPVKGEYRVLNQLEELVPIKEVADRVVRTAAKLGINSVAQNIESPRVAIGESDYFAVDRAKLKALGFRPEHSMEHELELMLSDLINYRDRIAAKKIHIMPKIYWKA